MKKMKKLASLMLALVMVLCLAAPAFAADANNSITINNAADGETYKAYKLLDLSVNEAKDSFTYTLPENGDFNSLFSGEGSIFQVNDAGAVTSAATNDSVAIKAFAQSAAELVKGTTPVAGQATAAEGKATISNLEPGYYLVISGKGTVAMIDTTPTNPAAQINEKNETPSITKTQETVSGNQPSIGDKVNYTVTIKAKVGAENYVLTDKMTTGLTFNNDVVIKVGETTLTKDTHYTVSTDVTDATFTITFTKAYLDSLTADTDIVVTYSATINADAVTVDKMTNSAKLNYGNNSETDWTDTTNVTSKVFGFDLVKTNSKDEVLSGAKFELYASNEEDATPISLVAVDGGYRVAAADDTTTTTTIEAGNVWIDGLGAGTYYLKETEAPEGYNAITGMKAIEVSADNEATVESDKYVSGGVEVENLTGAELPSTGGIGTTIFYTVGGLLVIGAGVLLVVKKRMTIAG